VIKSVMLVAVSHKKGSRVSCFLNFKAAPQIGKPQVHTSHHPSYQTRRVESGRTFQIEWEYPWPFTFCERPQRKKRKKQKKGEKRSKKARNETDVATDRTKKKGLLYEDPSFVKHQQHVRSNHHQPRFV
jgi:hypothetical protein